MKLGADGIFVELAGEDFELRPSLRASMRLVQRHGLSGLFAAVRGFNVTLIMDVLREAEIKPSLLLAEIGAFGLGAVRSRLTGSLAKFVRAIAGIDPDDATPTEQAPGKPVAPERVCAQLFGIATGWLGWTPGEAWKATPAEIVAARAGRVDLISDVLKAVFGSTESSSPTSDHYTEDQLSKIAQEGRDPALNRAGLHSLRNKGRGN